MDFCSSLFFGTPVNIIYIDTDEVFFIFDNENFYKQKHNITLLLKKISNNDITKQLLLFN